MQDGNSKLSIANCRKLLGTSAKDKSDEEVGRLRDGLYQMADAMFDRIQAEDPNDIRWESWFRHATPDDLSQLEREYKQMADWEAAGGDEDEWNATYRDEQ